jgi:hypothetical protein
MPTGQGDADDLEEVSFTYRMILLSNKSLASDSPRDVWRPNDEVITRAPPRSVGESSGEVSPRS